MSDLSPRLKNAHCLEGLQLPWIALGLMLSALLGLTVFGINYAEPWRQALAEAERVSIRSWLYGIGIALFPLTNLLRHIQLRLSQTMPLEGEKESTQIVMTAKRRYLQTSLVSMSMMETVGIFGFILFMLGDPINTLWIFMGMASLGFYLYRPQCRDYLSVLEALHHQETR